MKLRQKILLGILIAVVGFYVYTTFINPPGDSSPPAPRQMSTPGQIPVQTTPRESAVQEERRQSDTTQETQSRQIALSWERDPFFREKKVEITGGDTTVRRIRTADLVLNGIQGDNDNFIVTINDEFYRKGDFVDGTLKVIAIGKNYVVLREDSKDYILRLGNK